MSIKKVKFKSAKETLNNSNIKFNKDIVNPFERKESNKYTNFRSAKDALKSLNKSNVCYGNPYVDVKIINISDL